MSQYDHKKIEKKWRGKWEKAKLHQSTEDPDKPKFYVLDMFPYPSGVALHAGHPKGYIATDVLSRKKKMSGYSILHPMGWDAFGLPAENYAIKNKIHPSKAVEKNIATYKEQLDLIGLNFDWSREINTTDPKYYKWTQWIFLKLYEKGLAYVSKEPINWCPSCKTGLANEDLEGGKCERCGTIIEKKPMRQWVLKITDYADRMIEDLELPEVKWSPYVKELQRQWIGRSEGLLFSAKVKDLDIVVETFSAHYETAFSDMFVVIAPDHPLLGTLIEGVENREEIQSKIDDINLKRLEGGYAGADDVEGVFTGRYLVDPLGNGELPIWVASFAIADYGTGIIKCSAHDKRDFAFAKKYGIPLKVGLVSKDKETRKKEEAQEICHDDFSEGTLLLPEKLAGTDISEAREKVAKLLTKKGYAKHSTQYRLKDWVFSRQRYWGEPIPMLYCEHCYEKASDAKKKKMKDGYDYTEIEGKTYSIVPMKEEDLPLKLPEVSHYEPTGTGESPLASVSRWVSAKCPECDGKARRETNTMPQWAGSSWYYLRYMDAKNDQELVAKDKEKYWDPVDLYVGIGEHITRHMIYARFWHKFLYDLKVVSTKEPFPKYQKTGLILGPDGRKMSKRWGNVVNPTEVIDKFGADTYRLYTLFLGPFEDTGLWNSDGIMGPRRFVERVWRLAERVVKDKEEFPGTALESSLNKTIKKVTEDIEAFRFNTAIPALMTFSSELDKEKLIDPIMFEKFLLLLAPFAPHIADELWHGLGHKSSIHLESWPEVDESKIKEDILAIVVQINGKVRDTVFVDPEVSEEDIKATALGSEKITKWLNGATPKKLIYVKGRLVNIVVDLAQEGD